MQLHIKIKLDFEGLVDGIVGPIKSLIPGGKKTPAATYNAAGSYQLVPASSSYEPESYESPSYQAPSSSYESSSYQAPPASSYQPVESNYIEPEVSNRYEAPAEASSAGMFSTPYGKPPVSCTIFVVS